MEHLDGLPFDEYLRQRVRLSVPEAIPILRQIGRALDAAHAAGIAHRDLKPENVFLSFDDDGAPFPKLLDFGIAKLLDVSVHPGHKTQTGMPIGTPYYMAPEQCRGMGVDHRADIYSFGVMIYQVLTGKLPFCSDAMMSVLFMHMNDTPAPMSSVCTELPPSLDAPVLQMMAKDQVLVLSLRAQQLKLWSKRRVTPALTCPVFPFGLKTHEHRTTSNDRRHRSARPGAVNRLRRHRLFKLHTARMSRQNLSQRTQRAAYFGAKRPACGPCYLHCHAQRNGGIFPCSPESRIVEPHQRCHSRPSDRRVVRESQPGSCGDGKRRT